MINITLFIEILTKQEQYTIHQTPNQIVENPLFVSRHIVILGSLSG